MTEKPRVLFFAEGWGRGGTDAFVMDLVESPAFQETGWGFDVFTLCDWYDGYDGRIEALGATRTAMIPGRRAGVFEKHRNGPRAFDEVLKGKRYDAVYVNATNGMDLLYCEVARRNGVGIRVAHAHNEMFDAANVSHAAKLAVHETGRRAFAGAPTHRIAVSEGAGRFLFQDDFECVPNGIVPQRFAFDGAYRQAIREVLGIPLDAAVLGSVARLTAVKNPLFQIDVLCEYLRLNSGAHCLLAGGGDLLPEVEARVRLLGLESRVHLAPATDVPQAFLSAMDCFLMPSRHEGFGLTAVEAQASGLPVVASTGVPNTVDATSLVQHLPTDSAVPWAHAVRDLSARAERELPAGRAGAWRALQGTAFDAQVVAKRVTDLVFQPSTPKRRDAARKPVRVLAWGLQNNRAGTETVMANVASSLHGKPITFDFLTVEEVPEFADLTASPNGSVVLPNKRTALLRYRKAINEFFDEHASDYDAVWVNLNILNNIDVLRLAHRHGIPRRILHSHNSGNDGKLHQRILCVLNERSFNKYVTERWACSHQAGEAMFEGEPYVLVPNAIRMSDFKFDEAARANLRRQLNAEGSFMVGAVGRLTGAKNHAFLLDVMTRLVKLVPEAKLVIAGDGELRQSLEKEAALKGLASRVVFTGARDDVPQLLSAFDVYVMPSLFEGLPVSLLEAQANGLSCVVSANVSREAAISDAVRYMPLDSADEWARAIAEAPKGRTCPDPVRAARYDLNSLGDFMAGLFHVGDWESEGQPAAGEDPHD